MAAPAKANSMPPSISSMPTLPNSCAVASAAVPGSSIDWTVGDPHEIPIEERSGDEVRFVRGIEVVPAGSAVANPAFDVTPRRLVTGLVTERGVATPATLAAMFGHADKAPKVPR